MLQTNLQPLARFKTDRLVLKPAESDPAIFAYYACVYT